jgi:cell division protein FtsW (lipid II flippase)
MQQENLQLRANLEACERGSYSGKGPSENELSKRTYAKQEKRMSFFGA